MDSGKARAGERVEFRTYLRPPKELFAFGRLCEFQRERLEGGNPCYTVATYYLSTDQQRELDVMAQVVEFSGTPVPWQFLWVSGDLLLFVEVPNILYGNNPVIITVPAKSSSPSKKQSRKAQKP